MTKQISNFPEMTTTERDALTGVPTGTVVLNTTTNQFEVWSGAVWTPQTGGGGSGATTALDNLAAVAINTALVPGTSNTINVGSNSFRFANLNLGGEAIVYNGNGNPSIALNANMTVPSGGTGYRGMYAANITGTSEPLAIITTNQGTADAIATGEIRIESGNKTAGTGGSGSINIRTGTSAGGTRGNITLNAPTIVTTGNISTTAANTYSIGDSTNYFTSMYSHQVHAFNDGLFRAYNNTSSEVLRMAVNDGTTTPSGEAVPGSVIKAFGPTTSVPSRSIYVYTANDLAANANQTGELHFETGNKTAGTGNSGSIYFTPGTSSGGTKGTIIHAGNSNPATDDTYTLGSTSLRWNTAYFRFLKDASDINVLTADRTLRTTGSQSALDWSDPNNLIAGRQFTTQRGRIIVTKVGTTATTAVVANDDHYIGINFAGAAAVNLPAGVAGQYFIIKDESGAALTNNITINANGADVFQGGGASDTININYGSRTYVFRNGTWWTIAST